MSFWIQTAKATPAEYLDVCFPRIINASVFAMDHTAIPYQPSEMNETAPPVKVMETYGHYRYQLIPCDSSDPSIFVIYSQFSGRGYWLMAAPNETILPLRFWVGDFPPAGPHPTKFKLMDADGSDRLKKYIYSTYYAKFLCAKTEGDFNFVAGANPMCIFKFWFNTSSGPVIPSPLNKPVSKRATYFIRCRNGKVLQASLTGPVLTQAPLDYNNLAQQFYFRQGSMVPNPVQYVLPFSYNMHLSIPGSENKMICFEDNGNIALRTAAGVWEDTMVRATYRMSYDSAYFGLFKLQNSDHMKRLRANSDGTSMSLVSDVVDDTFDDLFSFITAEPGVPYLV